MMNGQTRQNILVDTSIPLEGGEDIIAKLDKVAPVFVTDIVLQELDGHKNNANGAIAYQAREFFRRLGKTNGEALFVLPPDGMKLEKTDTLRRMTLGNTPLHVIVRKPYKSRDINDSKIIEVAKDYNMTLVTLDMAQRVRAMSEGVNVETLRVEEKKKNTHITRILFIFGVVCVIVSILNLAYMFIVKTNMQSHFFISFASFVFGMISMVFSALISGAKHKIVHDEDTAKQSKQDTLSDSGFSLLEGNLFH